MVLDYPSAILRPGVVGKRVAIIGAGGIGFDVAELLTQKGEAASQNTTLFWKEWGIDYSLEARGGVAGITPQESPAAREVWLMQRSDKKVGSGLGKTTGWIHRASLKSRGVHMMGGVQYLKIDDQGLHISIAGGEPKVLEVDNVVICAGQVSNRSLYEQLQDRGLNAHLIGGSDVAAELDAKRAINQASRLAAEL